MGAAPATSAAIAVRGYGTPATVGANVPYGYAASGIYRADSVGAVHIAKREPEAEAEADPYYGYGYSGIGYSGLRSYGGYGLGYSRGYSTLGYSGLGYSRGYYGHGYGYGLGYGYFG